MEIKWQWGQSKDGYFLQLGQFVARDTDPQRGWLKLYRQVEAAVAKGEVADIYLYGQEISALYGTFNMVIKAVEEQRHQREREGSIVRNEKARLAMIDCAKHERYQA